MSDYSLGKITLPLSKEEVPTVNGYIYPKGFWDKIFNSADVKRQLDAKQLLVYGDCEIDIDLSKAIASVENYDSETKSISADILDTPVARSLVNELSSMKVAPNLICTLICNDDGIESTDLDNVELAKLCLIEKE